MKCPTIVSRAEFWKLSDIVRNVDFIDPFWSYEAIADMANEIPRSLSDQTVDHFVRRANDMIEHYWKNIWTERQKERIFGGWVAIRLDR